MAVKDTFFSKKSTLNCKGKLIDLSVPKIMGILNITPDSFYDGGRYITEAAILKQTEKMMAEGADFIDVGGYSSRPGAADISQEDEIRRLEPALKAIRKRFPDAIVSVDTFRSGVAKYAIENFETDMINDITAGTGDELMIPIVAGFNVPYIMMHMKGTPRTMQHNPHYSDVLKEILKFFSERLQIARQNGLNDVIIDPGFGFGKTIQHNFQILNGLEAFKIIELPLMVGLSRKSMIYKVLGLKPGEALTGTTVLNTLALSKGADILRVHDVKEARQSVLLFETMLQSVSG